MGLFSRAKKALKKERAHELQPCVLLKHTPITAKNHPHLLDETPGCADVTGEGRKEAGRREKTKRFWKCCVLNEKNAFANAIFQFANAFSDENLVTLNKRQLKRNLYISHLGQKIMIMNLTSLQDIHPIVELHDHQEPPSSEVLPAEEEQLEQDVLQHQDVQTPVTLTEADKVEELDKVQTSLQQNVEIPGLGEAPVSEGHIFWHYEFGQKLGQGGYGSVYAGTRCADGLKVAVKIASKEPDMPYIVVPGHPKRLPIEIGLTLMANMGSSVPQIIKLIDWQDNPDHYVMVLERPMPSVSMFNFVKLRRRLKEKMARHIMWQVIQAANVCCERGVFHRDIKLENLLLNPETLEVKLIDFGCGALMRDGAYKAFNGTEMYFCPPEFNVDGSYYAKPATVWSLGILLFVMVCGYYPDDEELHRISENEWSKPELSEECCQMIHCCLQPDRQRRLVLEEMQLHDLFMVFD